MIGRLVLADPPPGEVRDKMVEIFQRSEFQRTAGPLQKFLDWLGKQLDRLFPGGGPGDGSSSWGGPIGDIIGWVVLTLLAAFLVVLLVMVIRRRRTVRRRPKPEVDVTIEDHRTASEWATAAETFEAAGQWKEAIRCRYRELVSTLIDRDCVVSVPGRTTGELRQDVELNLPDAAEWFASATELFELPWYADVATGAAENARFKELAASIISATNAPRVPSDPQPEPSPELAQSAR